MHSMCMYVFIDIHVFGIHNTGPIDYMREIYSQSKTYVLQEA